jgi:hypothetical protein
VARIQVALRLIMFIPLPFSHWWLPLAPSPGVSISPGAF